MNIKKAIDMVDSEKTSKGMRALNRSFSLGEYGESWTKLERYLFIEIYNVIKDFYLGESQENIITFSSENIALKLNIDKLNPDFFKTNQKSRDLMNAAEGLSKKQINMKTMSDDGQYGFVFISMFTKIMLEPSIDRKNMVIKIPSEVYEEMVPIESYCLLDLKLLASFNSGNIVRLYEIFKSYAFRKKIIISFDTLRKKLGFYRGGSYSEWKHFNAKVLKPAVAEINSHKEYDIEVFYQKERGSSDISFTIVTHKEQPKGAIKVLNLNEQIKERRLNNIQDKYVATAIEFCNSKENPLNTKELTSWIVSDLINLQQKQSNSFSFKKAMGGISKQIRTGSYTRPFSHRHLANKEEILFNDSIYEEMKKLVNEGREEELIEKYSQEEIKVHQFGYLANLN